MRTHRLHYKHKTMKVKRGLFSASNEISVKLQWTGTQIDDVYTIPSVEVIPLLLTQSLREHSWTWASHIHTHTHAEAVTCEELLRWKSCESANLHMRARACCLWTWLLWLAICCNKRQVSPLLVFAPQCGKQTDTTILHLEAPCGPPATSIPPGKRTYNNISTH